MVTMGTRWLVRLYFLLLVVAILVMIFTEVSGAKCRRKITTESPTTTTPAPPTTKLHP
ncbi:hypothetical protein DPMN_040899 [Dreissena polymorpha]|uniref:Uncharacterized protein n=1 Tax=Dreissena polymorpha TaxID=45954 RepID=A0A9D4CWV9_DREPO|nr:hypothetical protein DPMN_040899 [Dreissena polymorpha]